MLQNFFILCSGADATILKTCSEGEQNKYAGIGATVFFTAVMAFIASSYALYTVFDNYYTAIFFGLIWGLLIFNLDRFIVSTLKKRNSFSAEFIQATPRIFLAVIIAIVLEQDIAGLKNEIVLKEAETNALYDIYISEAEGTAGTKLLGKGPVYAEKREKHDAALTALQTLKQTNADKISVIETQIADLHAEYARVVKDSQPIIDGFDGLMARITALNELPWLPSFFIFLLFLAIETSPIIAKLLAAKGAYDLKLEEEESVLKTWITQKLTQRNKLLETDTLLNDKIYAEIAEEEAVYAHKKEKTEELLKLQADAFQEIQIKSL